MAMKDKQRRAFSNAVCKYIASEGAWVTAVPGALLLRFECRSDSTLPEDLAAKLKKEPDFVTRTTRMVEGIQMVVDEYQLVLPDCASLEIFSPIPE
jgi:hypothetical protein